MDEGEAHHCQQLRSILWGGKNNNTLQMSCHSSAAQHLCLLPLQTGPCHPAWKNTYHGCCIQTLPRDWVGERQQSPQCSLTWAGFGPRRLKINFKRWQLLLYGTAWRDFWNKSPFWTQAEYNTLCTGDVDSFRVFRINLGMWAWLLHTVKKPQTSLFWHYKCETNAAKQCGFQQLLW